MPVRVYPRAYGETYSYRGKFPSARGLSPRIRGNHLRFKPAGERLGSIPAHTGKPVSGDGIRGAPGVYPRAYGETSSRIPSSVFSRGLSPRIRGNRSPVTGYAEHLGSIPAHTGKPRSSWPRRATARVYPRAYGETFLSPKNLSPTTGLSPRIRGNLTDQGFEYLEMGSIPAHTGKPAHPVAWQSTCRVYPRAYGETLYDTGYIGRSSGLSPRIRGTPPIV